MVFSKELEVNFSRNHEININNGSERLSHADPNFLESHVAPISNPYKFNV